MVNEIHTLTAELSVVDGLSLAAILLICLFVIYIRMRRNKNN